MWTLSSDFLLCLNGTSAPFHHILSLHALLPNVLCHAHQLLYLLSQTCIWYLLCARYYSNGLSPLNSFTVGIMNTPFYRWGDWSWWRHWAVKIQNTSVREQSAAGAGAVHSWRARCVEPGGGLPVPWVLRSLEKQNQEDTLSWAVLPWKQRPEKPPHTWMTSDSTMSHMRSTGLHDRSMSPPTPRANVSPFAKITEKAPDVCVGLLWNAVLVHWV